MSAAAVELVAGDADDPRWSAQVRLLRRQPSLLVHQVAQYAEAERELAELLRARLPEGEDAELRARLLAASLLTALRVAVQQWMDDAGSPLTESSASPSRSRSRPPRSDQPRISRDQGRRMRSAPTRDAVQAQLVDAVQRDRWESSRPAATSGSKPSRRAGGGSARPTTRLAASMRSGRHRPATRPAVNPQKSSGSRPS